MVSPFTYRIIFGLVGRQYLKDKIDELAMNSKNMNEETCIE
jgi:hypothetical protein